MSQLNEQYPTTPIDEARVDDLGHIIRTAYLPESAEGYNPKIEVFREPDFGQVYQMWAITQFAENDIAFQAVKEFDLAGTSNPEKERWTQLLEHITGVVAIADHLESMLERHGAPNVDRTSIAQATLLDNLVKPQSITAAVEMAASAQLQTAVLTHDLEKPAEIAASGAGGLENSRDNPVLREGRLWQWLHERGVSDDIILAAQNTGRSDRFFSELENYTDHAVKKALQDREALAELLQCDRSVIDAMTPQQRRRASIEAKGPVAALVGIADALAAQFKFRGITEQKIDAMSAHYLTYKTDPESVAFFGQDWPAYYKEVRRYLIDLVPQENRLAFIQELDVLTHEQIYNETVLPAVLGPHALMHAAKLRAAGKPTVVDRLTYVL
jgi:hypothetical protein